MDNSEEKTNGNTSPARENPQSRPDPIIQARDEPGGAKPPPQIVPSPRRVADETLLTPQFMGARGRTQAVSSARDIIESMLRFKWTALVVFVLVAGPAIAAIWTQVIPQYQARAEVQVRPIIPRLVFRTDENGMIPLYDTFVNTQVSIMRSPTVLQRVLDQTEVQKTRWYMTPSKSLVQRLRGSLITPMERLRDDLSVQPRSRTEIIDVSFMDPNAKDAKLVVDAVLDQYLKYTGEMFDATEDKLDSQLEEEYRRLENEIRGREKVSAELRRTLKTETPAELISAKRVRLDETQASLTALRQKIAALELQVKQAGPDDSNDGSVDPNDPLHKKPKYYKDEEWRKLDIDVKTIRHNIDNSILADKHPDAIRAHNDLAFAEELLRRREAQLDEQWRDRLNNTAGVPMTIIGSGGPGYEEGMISVENQLAQAKQQEQLLLTELEKQKTDFDGLFETAQSLEKENTALLHARELFDAVRQRQDQKNMERNVPGSIKVQMWAFVPSRPYNDRRMVFTAMALVMGLGMGGGAAFLRASKNQAVYTASDIPRTAQVPFLGYVPVTLNGKPLSAEPNPALTESLRIVRTMLLARLDGQSSPAILVTSATEGTGKSTFTLMLGQSLAQMGKEVILIDADFHKKTLTKHFQGLSHKSGFIQSLRSRSVSTEQVFLTETRGLSIVGVGQRGNGDAALEEMANGAVKTCIDKLRKRYNIILLDSPPILPLADATILAGQVDGSILVERELVSRRSDILSALLRLGSAGGCLLGTVFIGSGSHDRYGYASYYGRTSKS